MSKKYIFLMGAVLFLIGTVMGMSIIVEIITTILLIYIYSIVMYVYANNNNEDFKYTLLLSISIIVLSVTINNLISGACLVLLYAVLWIIYRSNEEDPVSEDMIENGSVIKIFYNNINGKIIFIHAILLIIYAVLYVKLNVGVASSITI